VQNRDEFPLAVDVLALLDSAMRMLLEGAGPPDVDLAGERRHLGIALLDQLAELDDVDEVVHGEQSQGSHRVGAVGSVDRLGLEERLGETLFAPTHEMECRHVLVDLERRRLGNGRGVQRDPDGPGGQDTNGHDSDLLEDVEWRDVSSLGEGYNGCSQSGRPFRLPGMPHTELDAYCAAHQQRHVDELIEALRIPSISADPAHAADVRSNAEHFAAEARTVGFQRAELIETAGHPAVYAERLVDPSLPTALIYGHHDVQPVDPLDEWRSAPFEPEVRDGNLYGRGAVDDKGQVWMHLKAVEAVLAVSGELPLNLKLIVEGEEESGSVHFEDIVVSEQDRLRADVLVVSDTAIVAAGTPSLCTGLRGLAGVEVHVQGPSLDLHSGRFGGAVANPVAALAEILASLHDPITRRVTVPGFYDDVRVPSAEERKLFASVPFDVDEFRAEAGGVPATVGEEGWTDRERLWARPTLEFNGIWGGYSGPGGKMIIPASAGAKITCRLVPNQDPDKIANLVRDAILAAAPVGVTVTADAKPGGRPVVTSIDHPAVVAASRAMADVFGVTPALTREGGSIPPVESFARLMGLPAVLVGLGLPDDQIHAPNEKFTLDMYFKGIRVLARLWDELAVALAQR
jgi:acetylornithine deacetylase/succinyl-diaminopimelate desuccinylase-like protein